MTHEKSFAVSRFQNRNGVPSWRVSGCIAGVRIRKNFPTREEAAAEMSALESRAVQAASGQRTVATSLSNEQVREAEAVFRRLEGRARPLAAYVDYALANYRDPMHDKPLADAITDYLAVRAKDDALGRLSHRQYLSMGCELRALEIIFRGRSVAELAPAKLTEFFNRGVAAEKSFNNRRGLVGAFLKHCLMQDWLAANPIAKVPYFRCVGHRRGSAVTLTAARCAEIMQWAEARADGAMVPFIVLCLFACIRPDLYVGEISKLQPEHVRLDTGVIMIEPEVSKVRMKRAITIQPNLATWLRAYPLESFPIMPRGFRRLRLEFRKKFNLTHDVLRHTFISMHVAKFRSMGEAALQAGNSESIIRKHYLDLKSTAEADVFFGIRPKRPKGSAVVVPMPAPALRVAI